MKNKKIIITGVAGFVGFHLARKLLKKKYKVFGIDSLNSYYDISLKKSRVEILEKEKNFEFLKNDLLSLKKLTKKYIFKKIDYVVHLAAQPGVQLSFKKPNIYIKNNIFVFQNILELCKLIKPKHLIYASSSSVYGNSNKFPLAENTDTSHPVSIYAVTKKTNELMSYVYSYNFLVPTTGIRFFTIYGPYGRPDMSILKFVKLILSKKKINLYNFGKNYRDFTYIDDVIKRLSNLITRPPKIKKLKNKNNFFPPYRILNFSEKKGIYILKLVSLLEKLLKIKSKKNFLPSIPGDVKKTKGENKKLFSIIKKNTSTPYSIGLKKTIDWYLAFKK